jgi:hypothetical protein
MRLTWILAVSAAGLLALSACGSGSSSAQECQLCTLQDHQAALGTPGVDTCATGHGADGHRLECNACESNCAADAASLRCGNDTDSSACVDGVY